MAYTLYHGDCLDVLPTLADKSVDAIIADPPYGTTACKWDSVIPFDAMWKELKRVIKPRGAIVLFGSQPFTSALVMSNPRWFRFEWVWDKVMVSGMGQLKYIPFKTHENILIFSEHACVYNPQCTGQGKRPFGKLGNPKSHTNGNFDIGKASFGVGYPRSIIREPRPK